jgi:MoaA/NifB/PqqE/SkfB family radical SAM enzyme
MATFAKILEHTRFLRGRPKELRLLARIAGDYLSVALLRRNRLRTVDLAVTFRCNARCEMCSAESMMSNKRNRHRKELSVEEIVALWKDAVRLGAVHINLNGGDPTMRNTADIEAIIRGVNRHGASVSIVSNGIALSASDLERYARAGLDTLQLSLSSFDSARHDRIKGRSDAYEKLMLAFRAAQRLKLKICLSSVLAADNFDDVKKIIEFGRKEKVFTLLNPIGAAGAMAGDFSRSIASKKKEYEALLKIPFVRADTVLNFRHGDGCPAGLERIYVTPYGDVLTCPFVQVSYGNVRDEPLEKIYRRICGFPYLRRHERECRHVFNRHYIERMLEPTFATADLPVPVEEHPVAQEPEVRDFLRNFK